MKNHRRMGFLSGELGSRLAALLTATAAAQAGAGIGHATVADDICAAASDPCIISGAVTVDPGSNLNLGVRRLQILAGAKLTWSGDLDIIAGDCDFEPRSRIAEATTSSGTGFLWMRCGSSTLAGLITTVGSGVIVEGDGPHMLSGRIKAKGPQAGVVAIDSYSLPGDITVTGKITTKSTTGTLPGEFRLATNWGDILIAASAKITMRAQTADPFSEFFIVQTGSGRLDVHGKIDARARSGGYAFNFEADQDVVFSPTSKVIAPAKGTGAEIAINSQGGNVTLGGRIRAPAKEVTSGDGARVHVCAASDILVDGGASIDSSSGSSGSLIIGAGGTVQVGTASVGATLMSKAEGDIEICGNGGGVTITGASVIVPEPWAVGQDECLSPRSQVIFLLDCNQ